VAVGYSSTVTVYNVNSSQRPQLAIERFHNFPNLIDVALTANGLYVLHDTDNATLDRPFPAITRINGDDVNVWRIDQLFVPVAGKGDRRYRLRALASQKFLFAPNRQVLTSPVWAELPPRGTVRAHWSVKDLWDDLRNSIDEHSKPFSFVSVHDSRLWFVSGNDTERTLWTITHCSLGLAVFQGSAAPHFRHVSAAEVLDLSFSDESLNDDFGELLNTNTEDLEDLKFDRVPYEIKVAKILSFCLAEYGQDSQSAAMSLKREMWSVIARFAESVLPDSAVEELLEPTETQDGRVGEEVNTQAGAVWLTKREFDGEPANDQERVRMRNWQKLIGFALSFFIHGLTEFIVEELIEDFTILRAG
jgi:hypothetical protein